MEHKVDPHLDDFGTSDSDWLDVKVGVVGLGIAGFACADALIQRVSTATTTTPTSMVTKGEM